MGRLPEGADAAAPSPCFAESVRAQGGRWCWGRRRRAEESGGRRPSPAAGGPEGSRVRCSAPARPEELRDAVELAANGSVALCAAEGGVPGFRLLRQTLEERYGRRRNGTSSQPGPGGEPGKQRLRPSTGCRMLPMERWGTTRQQSCGGRLRCGGGAGPPPSKIRAGGTLRPPSAGAAPALPWSCCAAGTPLLASVASGRPALPPPPEGKEGRVRFPVQWITAAPSTRWAVCSGRPQALSGDRGAFGRRIGRRSGRPSGGGDGRNHEPYRAGSANSCSAPEPGRRRPWDQACCTFSNTQGAFRLPAGRGPSLLSGGGGVPGADSLSFAAGSSGYQRRMGGGWGFCKQLSNLFLHCFFWRSMVSENSKGQFKMTGVFYYG